MDTSVPSVPMYSSPRNLTARYQKHPRMAHIFFAGVQPPAFQGKPSFLGAPLPAVRFKGISTSFMLKPSTWCLQVSPTAKQEPMGPGQGKTGPTSLVNSWLAGGNRNRNQTSGFKLNWHVLIQNLWKIISTQENKKPKKKNSAHISRVFQNPPNSWWGSVWKDPLKVSGGICGSKHLLRGYNWKTRENIWRWVGPGEKNTYSKRGFFPVLPYAPNTYPKINMEKSLLACLVMYRYRN